MSHAAATEPFREDVPRAEPAPRRRRSAAAPDAGRRPLPRAPRPRRMSEPPRPVGAAEIARRVAAREVSRRGGDARAPRPHRRASSRGSTPSCTVHRRSARSRRRGASTPPRRRRPTPGPLAGVPVAVKDVLDIEGVPTTCGSRILEGYRPPFTATAVARLEAAGAVVLGKTNMDEFAMGSSTENSAYKPTRNPWDRDARAGRLLGRLGGRGGRGHGAARPRHRHRRLDPPARGAVRRRRPQADLRPREPLRRGGLRLVARPGRPLRAHGGGRGPGRVACSAATTRTTPPAPTDRRARLRGRRSRPGAAGLRIGVPWSFLEEGVDAGRAGRVPRRRSRVLEARGRAHRRGRAAPRARTPSRRTTSWPRPRPRATSRASTACATACARPRARPARDVRRDARPRLRPGGEAAHHPRHVRALLRLLRRLLPARAEGADADPPRLRAGVRGLRRGGHAHHAHARLPPRREDGRPAADVPGRHLHRAREPGRHPGTVAALRPRRAACPSASSSWAGPSTRRRCCAPATRYQQRATDAPPDRRQLRLRPRQARQALAAAPRRRALEERRSTK